MQNVPLIKTNLLIVGFKTLISQRQHKQSGNTRKESTYCPKLDGESIFGAGAGSSCRYLDTSLIGAVSIHITTAPIRSCN